jgi:hypothetical protein
VVLLDAPISRLVEAEDALQDSERMLHLGSVARLGWFLRLASSSIYFLNLVRQQATGGFPDLISSR